MEVDVGQHGAERPGEIRRGVGRAGGGAPQQQRRALRAGRGAATAVGRGRRAGASSRAAPAAVDRRHPTGATPGAGGAAPAVLVGRQRHRGLLPPRTGPPSRGPCWVRGAENMKAMKSWMHERGGRRQEDCGVALAGRAARSGTPDEHHTDITWVPAGGSHAARAGARSRRVVGTGIVHYSTLQSSNHQITNITNH